MIRFLAYVIAIFTMTLHLTGHYTDTEALLGLVMSIWIYVITLE